MSKPVVSPATQLLCRNRAHFDRLLASAKEDTAEFIEYVASRANSALQPVLGEDMLVSFLESWGYYTFRRPCWTTAQLEFGLAYGCEGKIGTRCMDEYEHNISVRVYPLNQALRKGIGQKAFTQSLREALRPHLSADEDDCGENQFFACSGRPIPFKSDSNWDQWSEDTISALVDFARRLTPAIDRFSSALQTRADTGHTRRSA